MRELKFRAWDKKQKKMLYGVSMGTLKVWDENAPLLSNEFSYSEDCIFEQYTGLKDKNGKEIYEGDIIKSSEHIGEVYRQGNGRWVIFCGKDKLHDGDLIVVGELEGETYDLALTLGREYCKVIGNIHENPELIEKGE